MRLKDSHPGNLVRIPSQRLQHGHKQPTTNNCIQQLFYNFNNNIQTRNQPPDNHQPPDNLPGIFTHTHTHTKLRRSGVRGLCLPNGWSAPTISGDGTVSWLGTADDETEQSRGVQRPKKSWKPDEPDEWPGNYMYILHVVFIFFWNVDTFSDLVIVGAMLLTWFFWRQSRVARIWRYIPWAIDFCPED